MAETPGPFPTLSDNATVRIKLGLLASVIAAIIGGTVWLTTMYLGQNDLSRRVTVMETKLDSLIEYFRLPRSSATLDTKR